MEPRRSLALTIKSHVHIWFLCIALVGSPVEPPRRGISLLVGCNLRPSSRRRPLTWHLPTSQPSCLSRAAIRRYPRQRFSLVSAWMRVIASCSRLDRRPARYQSPDLNSSRIRHPARPEHTPSLTVACTISFLCARLTTFAESVYYRTLLASMASASIFFSSVFSLSSSFDLLATLRSMRPNSLFQRWNVTSEMFRSRQLCRMLC